VPEQTLARQSTAQGVRHCRPVAGLGTLSGSNPELFADDSSRLARRSLLRAGAVRNRQNVPHLSHIRGVRNKTCGIWPQTFPASGEEAWCGTKWWHYGQIADDFLSRAVSPPGPRGSSPPGPRGAAHPDHAEAAHPDHAEAARPASARPAAAGRAAAQARPSTFLRRSSWYLANSRSIVRLTIGST
jgi:hypothetical protein